MKWIKKILIAVLGLVLLIVVVNIGLNFWIRKQLPSIINAKNESPYQITYKSLEVSLLDGNAIAKDIIIVPKSSLGKSTKAGIYATVKVIRIENISSWSLLFHNKIKARRLDVSEPEITLYKDNDRPINNSKSINENVVKPFRNVITVSDINLTKCNLKILSIKDNQVALIVKNLSIGLNGVILDDNTLQHKIPFQYESYSINCDSVFFRSDEFYRMSAINIRTTNDGLKLENFRMIPVYSRAGFIKRIPLEKDLFTLSAEALAIHDMKWGFKEDVFFFDASRITLDTLFANIYRNKVSPDDLKTKKMYNQLLRELKFPLNVDTLQIRKSIVEYEEEVEMKRGPGLVSFHNFNATITHIKSGYKQTKLPDVNIKVNCRFMNAAPLAVNWKFNPLDKTDGFTINGHLKNFASQKLSPFMQPYINATMTGQLDDVFFNFTGNKYGSKGDFSIKYHDLEVKILKKNGKEKNKFLSAIGNLFVRDDSKEQFREAKTETERIPDKSFYNLLWRSVADGLKKTLL
ncbi:DUF748 domain-containing protein [Flavobacterium kingsejongi]|uniref:DUF748 domain-containing protein n=1 Tax=Flavobacterium kingsejongi TaxID=1678728 RepID=A0A2S1LMW6_9FLAO|nr:DUF748 domain-containing protein [Flavobacterium kingsejongi]AWG25092.1 hypothetical protein FK004_07520 [Flavobacterium kingsejongi]